MFSVTHPVRWAFPDAPGPAGLVADRPYFDRTPYVELDADGTPTYVEHHRTLGDLVRALVAAGLRVVDLVEPEWPARNDADVGRLVPGAGPDPARNRHLGLRPRLTGSTRPS